MTKYDRFLFITLLGSTLLTLIFLLGVDFLVQSGDEASDIGRGSYSFSVMMLVLGLKVPSKIMEFLPAAVLVGSLMGLGQLGAQNELTILRTSGISRLRIGFSGILLALLLGLGLIALGEFVVPNTDNKSETIRSLALGETLENKFQQGIWLNDENRRLVHIRNLNSAGALEGLTFYEKTNNGIKLKLAENANFKGNGWELNSVQNFSISQKEFKKETAQEKEFWNNPATAESLYALIDTESATTLRELYSLIQFLEKNKVAHNSESLRLWQRLFLPLSTLTMLLLALPFAFNNKRSSGGARLVVGILLGVSYYILQGVLSSLALLLNWQPVLGAAMPIMVLAVPALILLMKD